MPAYKVPPEKDYPSEIATAPSGKKEKRYPTVTICCDQAIIDALELNGDAEVTLRGKIVGLSANESNDYYGNRTEFRIELHEVEAEPGESADDTDDDESEPNDMQGAIEKGLGYAKDEKK